METSIMFVIFAFFIFLGIVMTYYIRSSSRVKMANRKSSSGRKRGHSKRAGEDYDYGDDFTGGYVEPPVNHSDFDDVGDYTD